MMLVSDITTELAMSMTAAEARARLDTAAKKLIKHRIILAEIMRNCVEEFKGFDRDYIMQNCFVGEVHMNEISVDQDVPDDDSSIIGSDTEDISEKEGLVRYDLVFDAVVPETGKIIRMVINIEIQVNTNLSYAVVTRAIYYLARLISRQKGTVFNHSDYEKIQKVYSIWICPDPKHENMNSIAEYGFTQQKVFGKVKEPIENYDKMKAIIISLNDEGSENRNDLIRLLSTLLSTTETIETRKQILEDEFSIPMTKQIDEEVLEMCNLGMAIEMKGVERGMAKGLEKGIAQGLAQGITQGIAQGMEKGIAQGLAQGITQGMEKGILSSIEKLMKTMKLTVQQAMDALEVPESEQPHYAALIGS